MQAPYREYRGENLFQSKLMSSQTGLAAHPKCRPNAAPNMLHHRNNDGRYSTRHGRMSHRLVQYPR
jgi:hypothetical protein